MANRKNDITPVGDGSVGIDSSINDINAQQIQRAVSEQNLKWQIGQNSSIKGIYNATLMMVRRWSAADKINLISAYGDVTRLSKTPSEDELNQALTTILISSMRKEDLKKILGEQEAVANQLAKDVRKTNSTTTDKAKRYFRMGNINSYFNETGKNAANTKQLLKGINKTSKFKIDKVFRKNVLPKLRQEIISVLSGFTNKDLAQLAEKMNVDFEDGVADKILREQIANKVNLYVAVLLGKQKGISHIGLDPDELEAIEDLLNLTSFAWVTGNATIGPNELAEKKLMAMQAKKRLNAQLKFQKDRYKIFSKRDTGKLKQKNYLINRNKPNVQRGIGRKIFDSSLFDDFTDEDYIKLAISLGLNVDRPLDDIKIDVQRIVGAEEQSINSSTNKLNKIEKKLQKKPDSQKLIKQKQDAEYEVSTKKSASVLNRLLKERVSAAQEYSDQVPVVSINESGKISSEAILKAVPVVVVGSLNAGRLQSKEQAKEAKKEENILINSRTNSLRDIVNDTDTLDLIRLGMIYKDGKFNKYLNRLRDSDYIVEDKDKTNALGVSINPLSAIGSSSGSNDSSTILKGIYSLMVNTFSAIGEKSQEETSSVSPRAKKILSQDQKNKMRAGYNAWRDRVKSAKENGSIDIVFSSNKGQLKNLTVEKNKLSSLIKYFNNASITPEKENGKPVIRPVLDLNKSHESVLKIEDYVKDIKDNTSNLADSLSGFKTLFAGLQQVGTSVNSVLASIGLTTAASVAGATTESTINAIETVTNKNATGGILRAKSSKRSNVSNIITGDHPKNKNNTELVSVDWANKKIKVKPIRSSSETVSSSKSLENSNLSSKRQLKSSDLNSPLSVGIQSGLVYYKKSLTDVTDDGSGTAVKVYSINSSINEKVKVGDSEMSIFDLLYGIYSYVPSIVSAINSGNTLLASISANTARTASNISNSSSSGGAGSFSFPNNLDSILKGI